MSSRIYWSLIAYGIFTHVMFKQWGGWLDALSSVLWIGGTVYLAYNIQWHGYGKKLKNVEPVMRTINGKPDLKLRFNYEHQDALEDVGFWVVWLCVLFVLDLFDLTLWVLLILLLAALIIGLLVLIGYISTRVRPAYEYSRQWLVWARARVRYTIEKYTKRS